MNRGRDTALPGSALTCSGFALLELLVVVALLVILTTLFWSPRSASREQQRREGCAKNLERLFIALQIYANDHNGKFPAVAGARSAEEPLNLLVPHYTSDTGSFICPGSSDGPASADGTLLKHSISYAYFMGRATADPSLVLMSDRQVDTLPKAAGQLVFSSTGQPPANNHRKDGGNLLFGDGHVQGIPARTPLALGGEAGVVLLNPLK